VIVTYTQPPSQMSSKLLVSPVLVTTNLAREVFYTKYFLWYSLHHGLTCGVDYTRPWKK